MTQPDQYFPDTAVNATPGFSAYAGTTQQDYEDAMADQWGNFLGPCSAVCMLLREIPIIGDFINIGQDGNNTGSMLCNGIAGGNSWGTSLLSDITGSTFEGSSPTAGEASASITTYDANTVKNGHSILSLSPSGVVDPNGHPTNANLLTNPTFQRTGITGVGTPFKVGNGWDYDDTDGEIGLGCAVVTADGHLNELVTNQIPVREGDNMSFAISTRWEGLSYTGSDPIVLGVTEYLNESEVGDTDLDTIAAPAADEMDWPLDGSAGALAADYTVGAGVDEIRMRLKIGANLTAGTVKWDNGGAVKTDGIRDDAVPGVGTTIDNITNSFFNLSGTGFTHNEAATAMTAQSGATTGNAAQIAALWSAMSTSPVPGVMDDFERAANSSNIGGDWDENYGSGSGHWGLDGSNAYWVGGTGDRESLCRWIGTDSTSDTDYQTNTVILGSAPGAVPGLFFTTECGNNDVIGRCDSTEQNYIRFRVRADGTWKLHKCVSGTLTQMASGTGPAAGAGTSLTLICGDKANAVARHYILKVNQQVVYNDTGGGDASSQYGASYRYRGFGALAEGGFITQFGTPGKINAFVSQDTE